MAKIILVSKQVSRTSWQLAQALRSQQHDVVLLTSYGEVPPGPTHGLQYMAYFKKWSFVEGLRIIPGLFGLQPQIVHLLLEEDRINPAQVVLSTFARSHPTCVLTTSLLNIKRGLSRRNPVRYLIEESDIITCPSVENLGALRGLNMSSRKQGRGILAPALDLKSTDYNQPLDPDIAPFLDNLTAQKFVVVPFSEPSFDPEAEAFVRLRILCEKYKVILLGSYSHWPLRERKKFSSWMNDLGVGKKWAITGSSDPAITRYLLEKCSAFILAGQPLTPLEMTNYYMQVIQSHASPVLDSKQASIHGELWKNGLNCWILSADHVLRDLIKLLAKENLKLPETVSARLSEDRHIIDSSLNELNRLYNRALDRLR